MDYLALTALVLWLGQLGGWMGSNREPNKWKRLTKGTVRELYKFTVCTLVRRTRPCSATTTFPSFRFLISPLQQYLQGSGALVLLSAVSLWTTGVLNLTSVVAESFTLLSQLVLAGFLRCILLHSDKVTFFLFLPHSQKH